MERYSLNRRFTERTINYDKDLNPQQLEVVSSEGGQMLVLAGAGTGKTRTITYRVAWLIEHRTAASSILLLTFINKAARLMMKRSEELAGAGVYGLWGGTFHHVCLRILKMHASSIGYKEGFTILDTNDAKDLFDTCAAEIASKQKKLIPKGAILSNMHSFSRNTLKPLASVIVEKFPSLIDMQEDIAAITILYEKKKIQLNLMDFDDILINLTRLMKEDENISSFYKERFRHILVDEYQDTNKIQGEIVDLLCARHKNIMVVGDDAQAIYSFRGASFDNIISFPDKYKDAKIFKLTTNYRSSPEILSFANQIILKNTKGYKKELQAVKSSSDIPLKAEAADVYGQARFVADKIIELVTDQNKSLSHIAVLYRSHYQSLELQMELKSKSIPYEIRSGLKFFEQAHIKDILSYLRITVNPLDELSWKRLFKMLPGIGNANADKLWNAISAFENPADAVFSVKLPIPNKSRFQFAAFLEMLKQLKQLKSPANAIELALMS
ncbi:UvrD/REP helicase, partial [Candidatus Magnetoovum chiemensis]